MSKPYLKWAGGKRAQVDIIRSHMPAMFSRLYEPFAGSAALTLACGRAGSVIGDTNRRLIACHRGIANDVDAVIAALRLRTYDKAEYYEQRARFNGADLSDTEMAALFTYLNKTCFNGLYRENKTGGYNVPFGRYKNPTICDEKTLRAAAKVLCQTDIRHGDFGETTHDALVTDVVYFDPPYVPLTTTSDFTSYTRDGFTIDDQRRLRDLALRLRDRGVHVILSNSSADAVRELYAERFEIHEVDARRSINSKGSRRGAVKELLMVAKQRGVESA